MGSRERKREQRRKRKRRSTERVPRSEASAPREPEEHFSERMARRSEQKNAAVRAKLEPLAEGERPGAVTVAAVVSAILALVLTASAGLAAAGVEVNGSSPRAAPMLLFAAVLWMMTWGLWKARYWAVLGFQTLLVLVLLATALGLVQVTTALQAIASALLLGGAGTLFYFMIRAMARIQMPERGGS